VNNIHYFCTQRRVEQLPAAAPYATLPDVQQPNTDEKHVTTQEHPVFQIAHLVYDRPDSVAALAAELRIGPEQLAELLADEPPTRGFS
jgi:hypothetical protein